MPKNKPKLNGVAKDGKPKPVRVYLPPADHAKLRIMAAEHGMSMSQFAEETLLEKIKNSGK